MRLFWKALSIFWKTLPFLSLKRGVLRRFDASSSFWCQFFMATHQINELSLSLLPFCQTLNVLCLSLTCNIHLINERKKRTLSIKVPNPLGYDSTSYCSHSFQCVADQYWTGTFGTFSSACISDSKLALCRGVSNIKFGPVPYRNSNRIRPDKISVNHLVYFVFKLCLKLPKFDFMTGDQNLGSYEYRQKVFHSCETEVFSAFRNAQFKKWSL